MVILAILLAVSAAANAALVGLWVAGRRRALILEAEDASERARAVAGDEAARESQARLQGVFSSSLVGVYFWGGDPGSGSYRAGDGDSPPAALPAGVANSAFCRMVGAPTRHFPSHLPVPCAPVPSLLGPTQESELKAKGACEPCEIEYRREDGTRADLLVAAALLNGRKDRGLCVAIDITRLKDTRRELRLSQERYRVLTESLPVGIWHIKPDGRTIYVNPAMCSVLELDSPGELLTSDLTNLDFFSPESRDVFKQELRKRTRGITSSYEVELVGKWGRRTRMLLCGAPVFAVDGSLESLIGTFLDISDRKREEEALRRSEERLRIAAECGNDMLYEWDLASGRVEWFGPIESRLGYAEGEIPRVIASLEFLMHPDDHTRVMAAVERHLRNGQSYSQEYRVRAKDGAYRRWTDRGTAIRDETGKPHKWIGSVSDVTEARRAEDELRLKEEQLRQSQKLEAVGRLAGGIAHDFNNLLAAIMGYCELMLIRLEPAHPCRKEVGEILNGSDRAAGLIRQLLAFSRQEIPQPKVINPTFVISSMEKILNHLLEANIAMSIRLDEATGRVRMDPVQLEQVILNLVINARDAMPAGGSLALLTHNVDLAGAPPGAYGRVGKGRYVRISVSDTGGGIDKEHLPHIFDPFFTTKDKGKGTGLGLSSVYGIVTQNKGCITVETALGKGSAFSIYLPLTLEELEEEKEVQRALRSSSIVPKTILVVEDDDEVRKIVRELLTQQGFLVLEAKKGSDALTMAEKYSQPLHLLLTDIVLPGMGGMDLAEALAKSVAGLRVIYMSGYTQDTVFREEVAAGTRAFIQKPFSMGTLIGKIREVLA